MRASDTYPKIELFYFMEIAKDPVHSLKLSYNLSF